MKQCDTTFLRTNLKIMNKTILNSKIDLKLCALLLILSYSTISLSINFLHFHPEENRHIFHEECPACLFQVQSNSDECSSLFNCYNSLSLFLQEFDKISLQEKNIFSLITATTIKNRAPPKCIPSVNIIDS